MTAHLPPSKNPPPPEYIPPRPVNMHPNNAKPIEPEVKPTWVFEKKPMNIREAMRLKIPVKEFFEFEGVALSIKWTTLIRVVNDRMREGKKLTLDTLVKDAIEAYTECMQGVFF